eukprot:Nk52_evm85s224 gene=Nk52_evmTU85s224
MNTIKGYYSNTKTVLGMDNARLEGVIVHEYRYADAMENVTEKSRDNAKFQRKWAKREKNADLLAFQEKANQMYDFLGHLEIEMLAQRKEFTHSHKVILAMEKEYAEVRKRHEHLQAKVQKASVEVGKKKGKKAITPEEFAELQKRLVDVAQEDVQAYARLEYEKVSRFKQAHQSLSEAMLKYHSRAFSIFLAYRDAAMVIPDIPRQMNPASEVRSPMEPFNAPPAYTEKAGASPSNPNQSPVYPNNSTGPGPISEGPYPNGPGSSSSSNVSYPSVPTTSASPVPVSSPQPKQSETPQTIDRIYEANLNAIISALSASLNSDSSANITDIVGCVKEKVNGANLPRDEIGKWQPYQTPESANSNHQSSCESFYDYRFVKVPSKKSLASPAKPAPPRPAPPAQAGNHASFDVDTYAKQKGYETDYLSGSAAAFTLSKMNTSSFSLSKRDSGDSSNYYENPTGFGDDDIAVAQPYGNAEAYAEPIVPGKPFDEETSMNYPGQNDDEGKVVSIDGKNGCDLNDSVDEKADITYIKMETSGVKALDINDPTCSKSCDEQGNASRSADNLQNGHSHPPVEESAKS